MANEINSSVDDFKKKKVTPSSMSKQSASPATESAKTESRVSPKNGESLGVADSVKKVESAKTDSRVSPKNGESLGVADSVKKVDKVGAVSLSTAPDASEPPVEASNQKKKVSPKDSPKGGDDLSQSTSKDSVRAAAIAKAKKALAKKTEKGNAKEGTEANGPQQPTETAKSQASGKKGTKGTASLLGLGVIRSSDKVVSQVLPEDIPQEVSVNRVRDPLTGEEIDVELEPSVDSSEFAWLEAALIASGVAALVALVIVLRSHTNLLVPVSAWARVKAANSDNPVFQTLLTVLAHLTGDVTGSVPSEACLIPIKTVDSSNFKMSKYMRGGRIAKAIKAGGVFRTPNQYIYRVAKVKTYRHFIVIETKEKESFLVVSYNQNADTLFMFSSTGETFSMSRELVIAPGIDVIG